MCENRRDAETPCITRETSIDSSAVARRGDATKCTAGRARGRILVASGALEAESGARRLNEIFEPVLLAVAQLVAGSPVAHGAVVTFTRQPPDGGRVIGADRLRAHRRFVDAAADLTLGAGFRGNQIRTERFGPTG